MQRHQGTEVELGRLQQLDLSDVNLRYYRQYYLAINPQHLRKAAGQSRTTYVLEGVDALCGLFNLTANDFGDQLGGELLQGAGSSLALDDLDHLLADGTNLGRGGVGGLADLVGAALGKSDSEEAEEVVVSRLDGDVGLNQRLPLADKRP